MDKKKRKVYTPAEKRRRNRRHNAIVTSIAVVLMLAGIIIIVSDTTFFFDDAGRWIRRNIFGEVFETIPPFPTGRPSDPSDPDDPNNPNIGPQGSLVPRPTFSRDTRPPPLRAAGTVLCKKPKRPCPKMLRKNRSFTIMRPNAFIFRNMI